MLGTKKAQWNKYPKLPKRHWTAHGRTTLWETVFSIFSGPENGSILKHRPIWIIRKVPSLCLGWLWASGGLKFWVGLVQEHAIAVSFGFEVLRFRLLQKYYSMPGRLKTSKPQKKINSLIKGCILVGSCRLGNLKTNRLLWFYVRSKPQNLKNKQNSVINCRNFCGMLSPWNLKTSKYVDSLTKCRILLGCCRLGNLKTNRLLWFYVRSKPQNLKNKQNSVIICRNFCGMLSPWNLKISKYVDSLTKCRILLGCCRLGNLKTDWSLVLRFIKNFKTSRDEELLWTAI